MNGDRLISFFAKLLLGEEDNETKGKASCLRRRVLC